MPARSRKPPLDEYRGKRSASKTPEPFGAAPAPEAPGEPRLFVIQKHGARRLHYDFRLELRGVLHSWAVPKGPSLDPAEKRLAVEVEDHPVEYADFEGVIPEGNYGAGPVILWDRGVWIPWGDPEARLAEGKLAFELKGYKLRGIWHLVRTKRTAGGKNGREWLLIKKPDEWARAGGAPLLEDSILSGLTLEELEAGPRRAHEVRGILDSLGAPRRRVAAAKVQLMLAETREEPFSAKGWLFELKHDGFRLLAAREDVRARLLYRRGSDATAVFPEIARALESLPFEDLILDGEVVVLEESGRPSFQGLQKRVQLSRRADIERASVERPATLFAFDLVAVEGFDLRPLPLLERKRVLRRLLPAAGPLRFADHVEERGEEFYEEVRKLGLEGIMAKRASSPYVAGRSPHWLKVRVDRAGDFVVVGFTEPQGSRSGFGALHLAAYEGGELMYAGRVGSGFSEKQLRQVRRELEALARHQPACKGPLPRGREHVWVEPRLVCEVRYKEWTEEGLLRQPVLLRLREDKAPDECLLEGVRTRPSILALVKPPQDEEAQARKVALTNPDKVFWPDEGYTKGDLIDYYRAVSTWLLPYLEDRPLVLTRYPDGIAGKSFYQKDAPDFVPGWIRTERIWSEHSQRDIDYFVCQDVESLVYLANLGTIPLHVWPSRAATIQRPDWCILDLDPKGAPFEHVVRIARALGSLADEIGLPAFIKTSGASGLHVLIPLGVQCTYEQSRSLAQLMAWVLTREMGDIATIARSLRDRGGRVYVDYLQNVHGQLLVAPFSVRPLPGAPVSTPLRWSEVKAGLDPRRFTIATVPRRLARLKGDPMRPVLEEKPDLLGALERLQKRLGRASR